MKRLQIEYIVSTGWLIAFTQCPRCKPVPDQTVYENQWSVEKKKRKQPEKQNMYCEAIILNKKFAHAIHRLKILVLCNEHNSASSAKQAKQCSPERLSSCPTIASESQLHSQHPTGLQCHYLKNLGNTALSLNGNQSHEATL